MNPFSNEDLTRLNLVEEEAFKKQYTTENSTVQFSPWTPVEHNRFMKVIHSKFKVARLPNLGSEESTLIRQIRHFASPNRSEEEVRLHYALIQRKYPHMRKISPVVSAVLGTVRGPSDSSTSVHKRTSSSLSEQPSVSEQFEASSPPPAKRLINTAVEEDFSEILPDSGTASFSDGQAFARALLQENERLVSEMDSNVSSGKLSTNVSLMQQFRQNILVLQNWLSCTVQMSKLPELPPLPVKINLTFFPAHQTYLNLEEIDSSLQNLRLSSEQSDSEAAKAQCIDPSLLGDMIEGSDSQAQLF